MTDEMKLLQELCKALGFQVERTINREERKETQERAMRYNRGLKSLLEDRALKTSEDGGLDIDKDGMYISYLVNPIISYKLTKIDEENKNDQQH